MQKQFQIPRGVMTGKELLEPGVLSCQGCGASLAMKLALKGLDERTVIVIPACCFSVISGVYPYSALRVPVIHVPFATAAVSASGVRAGLDARGEQNVVVVAWAGDGGTFDIGIQSLSGAAERNDNIIYVCYDNEAYMNTGIQRSSATPIGAWTSTTPAGFIKSEPKKDLEKIMRGHSIPYIATTSVAYPDDLIRKFKKAREISGTRFIHILSPCPPGWQIDPMKAIQVTRMATQAKIFPIYEVENGRTTLNIYPEKEISVQEYIKSQGRFRQIDKEMLSVLQGQVDRNWDELIQEADKKT
jgi:pyruvate/2-oxoacid:ferredoxin oxidoreductase beta subunit